MRLNSVFGGTMIYRFGEFRLNAAASTLQWCDTLVDLPKKTVDFLNVLVARRGEVVSKAALLDALWPQGFVEEGNLTQHVYLLRRAFAKYGLSGAIDTIPRRGYRFNPALAQGAPSTNRRRRAGHLVLAAGAVLAIALAIVSPRHAAPAIDGETMRLYGLGRYYWNLRSREAMLRSTGYFRRVISRVPNRALGYAGLADAFTELDDFERPCSECGGWGREAEKAAETALKVEPQSSEALVSSGMAARILHGDDTLAERRFRAALTVDPENSLAHEWLGNLLIAAGRFDEGRHELEIAASREPVATATYAWLARADYYTQRYAEAESYARQALALQPARLETTRLLGLIEEARGQEVAALKVFDRVAALGARTQAAVLRDGVYATMGQPARAIALLHRVAPAAENDPYASRDMVAAYIAAGDGRDARAQLAHVTFTSRLDRELFAFDMRAAHEGLKERP